MVFFLLAALKFVSCYLLEPFSSWITFVESGDYLGKI